MLRRVQLSLVAGGLVGLIFNLAGAADVIGAMLVAMLAAPAAYILAASMEKKSARGSRYLGQWVSGPDHAEGDSGGDGDD